MTHTPEHTSSHDMTPPQSSLRIVPVVCISMAVVLVLISIGIGGTIAYGELHREESAKGLMIGDIPVGGMTVDETTAFVDTIVGRLMAASMQVVLETPSGTVPLMLEPVVLLGSDGGVQELVWFDEEQIVEDIMTYGKTGNRLQVGWQLLTTRWEQPTLTLSGVTLDRSMIQHELEYRTEAYRTRPVDANITITKTAPIEVTITPSQSGQTFDFDAAYAAMESAYWSLRTPDILLPAVIAEPTIVAADLEVVSDTIETVLAQFPLQIIYTNTTTQRTSRWTIYPERAATFLEPKRNGDIYIGLREHAFLEYLDTIVAPDVTVAPQNARFSMNNGRVTEFQGAREGVAIATSTMAQVFEDTIVALNEPGAMVSTTIPLVTTVAHPDIATEDVNDLGITELLGVGTSNFKGSTANRIANIRNAVNKLNGIIIEPGAEFSTIEHTKPYTLAGGYVPELVIKGDNIIPEVGGGLCQIGTTLFRMAMNSGMDITERRNHSLVVSYYNDLENGLPGTDATLYDPAPDFKFRNDTGQYVLIAAEMNVETGFLHFYLWGTSDGRTASYAPPQVHRWTEPGPTRYVESPNLAPGEMQCQNAYRGAQTSFTYTRQLPGQDAEEVVFSSTYRALPRICLVGPTPVPVEEVEEDLQADTEVVLPIEEE